MTSIESETPSPVEARVPWWRSVLKCPTKNTLSETNGKRKTRKTVKVKRTDQNAPSKAAGSTPKKRPRKPWEERLGVLERLAEIERDDRSVDERVRENLSNWYSEGPQPAVIRVRPGFLRRVPALTKTQLRKIDLRDRPKTKLPAPPPLALLVARPRGEGLRVALTLLFLIQTGSKPVLGADGRVQIPVERGVGPFREEPYGLKDLIAIPATHSPPVKGAPQASSRESNRREQIATALQLLTAKGIGMIELPNAPGSPGRFNDVRLRNEVGTWVGDSAKYRQPGTNDKTVDIPVGFFLNGWLHTLNKREIAMWLMLRSEMDLLESSTPIDEFPLTIDAHQRLTVYDLALGVYETNSMLNKYGLIEVQSDPDRNEDGTGPRHNLAHHAFKLNDNGLATDALTTVTARVREEIRRQEERRTT
ncbi:hypothetical protein [Gordonia sp. NPDC058843]|uniref:hypothetical protein n=1 Tax=Gordonia sp. NPDC058843 TaxID=3346648 RepID=UPI0036A4BFEC